MLNSRCYRRQFEYDKIRIFIGSSYPMALSTLRFRYAGFVLLWSVMLISASHRLAYGNGWEHTAVPVSKLILALKHQDPAVRERAAHSLGHHSSDESIAALINALADENEIISVRKAVFVALSRINTPRAIQPALQCIDTESQLDIRVACIESIRNLQDDRIEDVAVRLLSSPEASIQRQALRMLSSQSSKSALTQIQSALQSSDNSVRLAAINALGHLAQPDGIHSLSEFLNLDTPVSLLIEALKAVVRLDQDNLQNQIQDIFEKTGDPRVKRHALLALNAGKNQGDQINLVQALSNDDPLLVIQALEIVREQQDPELVSAVIKAGTLIAEDFYGQSIENITANPEQAIVQLSLINEFLRTLIATDPHHGEKFFRTTAMPMELPRNSPALLAIAEGLYKARWQGIYAGAYTHTGSMNDAIELAMTDPDARLRAVAVRSAGVNAPDRFYDSILSAVRDKNADVRVQAVTVLGRFLRPSNLEPLVMAVSDPNSRVREEAVRSLGYLGETKAITVLENAQQNDSSDRVKSAARVALDLIQQP